MGNIFPASILAGMAGFGVVLLSRQKRAGRTLAEWIVARLHRRAARACAAASAAEAALRVYREQMQVLKEAKDG